MSTRIMPISDLRRNVSQTIREVQQQDNAVYITQHGRPQAVLVSYEHYEQLLKQSTAPIIIIQPVDPEIIAKDPEMIALIEKIKTTPPKPASIRPATAHWPRLCKIRPEDPDFDLETWTQQWDAIEAEMKAIDRANDIAEERWW